MVMTKRTLVVRDLQRVKAAQGLSQQQVAERIGVTQPAVSDWLSGKSLPDAESLGKIKSAFPELADAVYDAALEFIRGRENVA